MNEQQFHDAVDALFLQIEEGLEKSDMDLDFGSQEGILTITLPDENQIILSRQTATKEVWLASKKGAYHFRSIAGHWQTAQGHSLLTILNLVLDSSSFSI